MREGANEDRNYVRAFPHSRPLLAFPAFYVVVPYRAGGSSLTLFTRRPSISVISNVRSATLT